MKAVILVGGEATRLLPLTCNIPKAIIPVLNTPFLEYVIRYLSQHQIKDIILTQGHLSFESYLGDGSRFGVKLSYTTEDNPLGTAGAVKNAEKHLDGTFLVLNGDIFTELDITAMISFHLEKKAKITIALTEVDDPTSYGLVETDTENRITSFLEKPSWNQITTNMINAGVYVLEPDVLAQIPPQANFSFEHELFPLLLDRGEPIYAYPSSAYWIDMGTPEKYLQLHRDLLSGKGSANQYSSASGEGVLIGEQSYIHPKARIKGPVVIGSGCTILEGAVIEQSIIWHKVKIGRRATVRNSIVANHCCLNDDSIIEESVLGDNVTLSSGCKLEPGSKIWPGLH
jgi:mannose-1-phosphate guanylyltransferase